jgi:hypothetical protein
MDFQKYCNSLFAFPHISLSQEKLGVSLALVHSWPLFLSPPNFGHKFKIKVATFSPIKTRGQQLQ